jgi:hypothetical protein
VEVEHRLGLLAPIERRAVDSTFRRRHRRLRHRFG